MRVVAAAVLVLGANALPSATKPAAPVTRDPSPRSIESSQMSVSVSHTVRWMRKSVGNFDASSRLTSTKRSKSRCEMSPRRILSPEMREA